MTQPVFRFAPSPNGRLHLGHALSALLNHDAAHRYGGRFLLRIEDIDLGRRRPEFVDGIFTDLAWLGLVWEEPVRHQSAQFDTYRTMAAKLAARHLLYPCFCTRQTVQAASMARDPDGAPLYAGTCRDIAATERAKYQAAGRPFQMRLDMAAAIAAIGQPLTYMQWNPEADACGEVETDPLCWGDVVIQRKDVPTSYHLAVVVDDAAQGVTHVVRGQDLLAATAVHRILQALLGLPAPRYHHHRLILDDGGAKLAKSRASMALETHRAAGRQPADIRAMIGL